MVRSGLLSVLVLALVSCSAPSVPGTAGQQVQQPLKLKTGEEYSVDLLEKGRVAYIHNCRQCHGDDGDGNGPSAPTLRPPPRDFTREKFRIKFGAVSSALPSD